jgi:hypothetical protein
LVFPIPRQEGEMLNVKFVGGAAIGSAVGYIAGARAGRARYEKIVGRVKGVGGEKFGQVSAKSEELLDRAKDKIGAGSAEDATPHDEQPRIDADALAKARVVAAASVFDDTGKRAVASTNGSKARAQS